MLHKMKIFFVQNLSRILRSYIFWMIFTLKKKFEKISEHFLDIFCTVKLEFIDKKKFYIYSGHILYIFQTCENSIRMFNHFFRTKNGYFPDILKYTWTISGHFCRHFPDIYFL